MRTKLVSFDLDGTLISGTTTTLFLAKNLGFLKETLKYEEDYKKGLYNNNIQIAQMTARHYQGVPLKDIRKLYARVPKIANISPTIAALKKRGIIVILASITCSFFVEMFAKEYGFDSYCGTNHKIKNNIITGEIEKYCTELDKLQFFLSTCHTRRIALSDTLAIGDSRSDHPIFRKAGISIALNADKETKALATHSLDTKDLLDVLNFIK